MAEEEKLQIDKPGFETAMQAARELSRGARGKGGSGALVLDAAATDALQKKGVQPTNDKAKYTPDQVSRVGNGRSWLLLLRCRNELYGEGKVPPRAKRAEY
jgi:alanyl-tRNA synthetase